MPRVNFLTKNEMQLALALSSSLEESKKQEVSKLTENLSASCIEDGTVPQDVKQLQIEFLEKFQGPKPGPSRKSKKPLKPAKPVPILISRSAEERLRIITEKVALVLIKDDTYTGPVESECNLEHPQGQSKENMLWCMSWMLTNHEGYYIQSLNTYISPSKIKVGAKRNKTHLVSTRLITPVKYKFCKSKMNPTDYSSQSSSYTTPGNPSQSQVNFVGQRHEMEVQLQTDWLRMVNNSNMSDVTIIVKERYHLCAHKLVLFTRCPAMIEDLDSDNLLHWRRVPCVQATAFLEYLYCGKLTAIICLGKNLNGIIYLAKKYKLTDLLKYTLGSNLNTEECDTNVSPCSPQKASNYGSASPDLFADPEETIPKSGEMSNDPQTSDLNELSNNPSQEQVCIEISSDEEDLVKEFFGTYNPTTSNSSYGSQKEVVKGTPLLTVHECTPQRKLKQPTPSKVIDSVKECTPSKVNKSSPSTVKESTPSKANGTLSSKFIISSPCSSRSMKYAGSCNCAKNKKDSDTDGRFSSREDIYFNIKSSLLSPETKERKEFSPLAHNAVCISSSSDEEVSKTLTSEVLKAENCESPIDLPLQCGSDHSRKGTSKRSCKSLFPSPKRKCVPVSHIPTDGEGENSFVAITPLLNHKESSSSKQIQGYNSFSKTRQGLNEKISFSSSLVQVAQSSLENIRLATMKENSPNKILQKKSEEVCSSGSYSSGKVPSSYNYQSSSNSNAPFRIVKLKNGDPNFPLGSFRSHGGNERNLLDDSFNFDVNDSMLLKDVDCLKTPEPKTLRVKQLLTLSVKTSRPVTPMPLRTPLDNVSPVTPVPFRTPLDSVKASSPVTPMPDYETMSDEQFEMELQKFGLKRGLSRKKGIKMLTHIYGKLHPMVEVISQGGKEVFIPLGEKTPSKEQPANDEPQPSTSNMSSNDSIVLEETVFEEEDESIPGVPPKDLKTAVWTWITSQPEIHEMILCYEPIWLDSFHEELRKQFDKKIKVSDLMDVLDEEGITFRTVQGHQNRRKMTKSQ